VSPQFSVISGGIACIVSAFAVAIWAPELPRYDRTAHMPAQDAAT
jgi:hypothetical protein